MFINEDKDLRVCRDLKCFGFVASRIIQDVVATDTIADGITAQAGLSAGMATQRIQ